MHDRPGIASEGERGQSSPEYVGVVLLVAVLLGGLAALAWPGVAPAVVAKLRLALCRVVNGVCTPAQARAEGLEACVVHASGTTERAGLQVLVVRVGRTDALLVERRSDGTGRVSFLDGGQLTGELAAGMSFSALGVRGEASVGAGVRFTAGEAWEFPRHAQASRFAQRWAREERLSGEARRRVPGGRDPRPSPPTERYVEGGLVSEVEADLEVPGLGGRTPEGDAGVGAASVVGRRDDDRAGTRTWYLRMDAHAAGRLGLVVASVSAGARTEVVLEYTTRHGQPHELRARAGGHVGGDLRLGAATARLPEVMRHLRGAVAGGGTVGFEAAVALDLRHPENRRAAAGLPALLRPGVRPADVEASLRHLAARLDADGTLDVQTYRLAEVREADVSKGLKAGGGLGVEYERTAHVRQLLRAWSLRRGGSLREREDCRDAARV